MRDQYFGETNNKRSSVIIKGLSHRKTALLFTLAFIFFFTSHICHLFGSGVVYAVDAGKVYDALKELNGKTEVTQQDVKELCELVRKESGDENVNVLEHLKKLKSKSTADEEGIKNWAKEVGSAENEIMSVVREGLKSVTKDTVRGRAQQRSLGGVLSVAYSGKWGIKAKEQLTFDTDFDISFFADTLLETDPHSGIIAELNAKISEVFSAKPEHLGIVITGCGHEASSDVYVSRGGTNWALRESMTEIYFIDPVTGEFSKNFSHDPGRLFVVLREKILWRTHPELFSENGKIKPGITVEEIQRILNADPNIPDAYKLFIRKEGSKFTKMDAATAAIDMSCHVTETIDATTPEEAIAKIAKQVARSSDVFDEAMKGSESKKHLNPEDAALMEQCQKLDKAKINEAKAHTELIKKLEGIGDPADWTPEQAQALDSLIDKAKTARKDTKAASESIGGSKTDLQQSGFRERAVKVMRKQAEAAHFELIGELLKLPPSERARAMVEYQKELQKLQAHYGKKKDVPKDILEWAATAEKSVTSLIEIETIETGKVPKTLDSVKKIHEAMKESVDRANKLLRESEPGKKILEKTDKLVDLARKETVLSDEPGFFHPMSDFVGEYIKQHDLRDPKAVVAWAGTLAMAASMIETAMTAKDDTELALGVGHSLVQFWPPFMIAESLGLAIKEGDNEKLAKAIMMILLPETALFDMAQAIGNVAINIAAALSFDAQLDALYYVSLFNEDKLAKIDDYDATLIKKNFPTAEDFKSKGKTIPPIDIEEQFQRSEGLEAFFYWAFVEQGGEILLQKMINEAVQKSKTVLADEAKGINFFMQATVRQTVRSTVINANQLIFKDDGPLQTACANIRKYDQEINDFTSAFKIEITSNAKPSDFGSDMNNPKAPGWALDLDQGQARALSQLIFNREKWRIIAKEAFLEATVRTLEIRDRAEKDVNANKRDELYKKLTDLFKDLDILEVGNASFQYKSGYNIATRIWAETLQFKTRHERDVYEMKVLQAFLDAYSSVKQAREAIENAFRSNTEKDSVPRPLTSSLPLTGEPEKDAVLAQEFAQEMSTAAQRIRQVLEAIKKGTLDKDGYDQQMYSRIYEAHYLRTFFDIQRKAVRNMAKEIRFWQLVKIYDAETAYSESDKKGQEYKKLYDGLVEDFRKHYAETQISISISGPDKGEVDKEVKLEAVLKDNDNKTAEIPKDSKIEWISDEKIIFTGKTYTFVPDKPGVIEINLTLIKEADGKREIIAATKTPYRLEIASWKPTVTIKGPGEGEVGKEIGLFAEVLADDAMKKSLQLEWSVEGHKDLTGKGLTFKFTPKEAGIYKVKVEAYSVVDNREFKVAEDDHDIKVRGWKATIRITGDRQGEVGKPVTLSADVSTDETQRPLVRVEWVYTASGAPVGSGTQFQFTPDRAGVHTFKAILYLPAGGTEFPVATDTWPVTVQDRQGNVPTPCTYKYSDWGECQPNGTQSRAVLSSDRFGCTETPITVRPCTYVPLHDKDRDTSTAQPDSQNIQVGEATVPPDDKKDGKPTTGDPKQQAEEKYRWLKESVAYLEALKEYDRKSYNSFEKSVTSSIVREFVSKAPPRYDKEFKLPDGPDKELCGETFGDIRDRLRGYESECWSTSNAGCKTVGTREVTRTVDGKQIKFAESISSCDIPCGKAQTCSNVLKTYSGQLGYANDLQDYINEKQLGCLGEAGAANGKHQRELDKKIKDLPESLAYKRFQEFAGFNDWKGYLAAVEKVKQEFALPDPIPSPIVLPWSYSSPCGGGAGPVADTSKLVVTLAAKPEKTSYKPGDVVSVTAGVTGGKPPYTYTWTGDHAGEGQTVTRAATKPGSYALSVEVKDGTGARGQASITLKYEGVTAEIAGLTNQIIYGTSLTLRVNVPGLGATEPPTQAKPPTVDKVDPEEERQCTAWKACRARARTDPKIHCMPPPNFECWDDSPAKPEETSSMRIIWQSDKTLDFQPGTSYDGTTIVLFDRMGVIKIWAEIEKKTGDKVYERVGETDQREVTVVPPKFKMTFNPEKGKGKVGQEVRVTIETDPPKIKPEIINYEWNWPESSGRMEYEKNASVIGFVPKDPKPVKLLVAPKTVYDRVPIGGAIQDEYTAGAFNVTVTGPRAMGPTPQIWKEKVGLVNVEQQIAVFQNVSMRAEVAPDPEKKPLRYQWTVTPAGCTIGNDISQEITVNCSQTGSYQAKVTVKDRDGADLGSGSGTISVTISQQTLNDSAKKAKEAADKTKEGADKAKKADEAKKKLAEAKADERKGKLDDAIKKADEAAALDPSNKEATTLSAKWKADKKRIDEQLAKTKQLIDESKFVDAQRELIVAKNLHGSHQPVLDMDKLLSEKWRGYDGGVRDRLYEVRSANEKKDFKKALELADKMRKEMKLYGGNEESLKQQEDWARRWEAEKDGKRKIFKGADEKLKNFDYAGAYKTYEEGFMNAQNLWSGAEPEYKEAMKGREEAFLKNKRLNELTPHVQRAAEDMQWQMPVDVLQGALKTADEAIALQPNNDQLKKWRVAIEARLGKTTTDNQQLAAGRKYLEAARTAENSFLSQESYVRADPNRWGEKIEGEMQSFMEKAIENYTASLKHIPDPKVEQHIKDLMTALDGRKKFLENVRLSKKVRTEGDQLIKEARSEQSFEVSQDKFSKGLDKYKESLKLYSPPDVAILNQTIYAVESDKQGRIVSKYRADGEALEREGRIVDALAAYQKAYASYHVSVPQTDRMQLQVKIQEMTNRINGAKSLRAQGETQQKQGKVAEAIASYEQSLKLVPDKALTEHVRLLKAQLAKGDEKKQTADRLWQEGTALFNQGRPADALAKFKESLTYWQDATRTKYVQDMEGRRTQAQTLRDQGAQLQQQNRLPDAIARYNQSLQFWPDPKLKEHIAALQAKLKEAQDTEARKAQAKRLRDEGAGFQQQNRIREAINKYRESLTYWPDNQLEEHVRKLEASLAAVAPTPPTPPVVPPVGPTPVPPVEPPRSLDGVYSGQISGAASGTIQMTVTGDRTTGTINGTYQGDRFNGSWSGTVNKATGDLQGTLKGEVSGYAFTGGINGRIQGAQATGSWNARNQYGNPTGAWQATRGGGVSPMGTGPGAVSAAGSTSQRGASVMAEITNKSRQNAHIFVEGESFGPANRFAPGESRKVSVAMPASGSITFKAGRDGTVMATKRWTGDTSSTNRIPVVIFDDTNPYDKLIITTGLR